MEFIDCLNRKIGLSDERWNHITDRIKSGDVIWKTNKIVGFTILNFEKRFEQLNKAETLPIIATFAQIDKAIEAEG
jgi:hypothetical protein